MKAAKPKTGNNQNSIITTQPDWEVDTIGNCFDLINGMSFKSEDWKKEGLPIIRIQNLNEEESAYNYYQGEYDKKHLVKSGDILFAWSGTKGVSFGAREWTKGKALLNQHIFKVSVKSNKIHNDFILPLLIKAQQDIEKKAHGFKSSFVHVTKGSLEKIRVLVPSISEQQLISSILSKWETAITTYSKLIAQKELRKKWLMQQLLTGKKRLKGFEKHAWNRLSAGEIFRNVSIKGSLTLQLLSATQDKGMIPRDMLEARVTMPSGDTGSFKLVEMGDFVISLRSFQGGLEYSYYKGLVSPAYTVLKPIKKIDDEFYKQYFKSYDFIGHLATAVIGIRDGKQISFDDFCVVKIPNPSFEEQTDIASVLSAADKESTLLRQKLEKLKEQKKGLMQMLLTGKKRLGMLK